MWKYLEAHNIFEHLLLFKLKLFFLFNVWYRNTWLKPCKNGTFPRSTFLALSCSFLLSKWK